MNVKLATAQKRWNTDAEFADIELNHLSKERLHH